MQLKTKVSGCDVTIDLEGVSQAAYDKVGDFIGKALARQEVKNRDLIKDAYIEALRACPTANASDVWHHVVYRRYFEIFGTYKHQDPKQSWVRASGDALELVLEEWYQPHLDPHLIRIRALIGKPTKLGAITAMGINEAVGSDKLDIGLYLEDTGEIFGGVHVKASLAERVSDDVPCSRAMMDKGYFSPLWTLDVKSFPPPTGDLINRGELGSANKPSEKRKYVEIHGSFDNLYSANARSKPSGPTTPSGKKVYRVDLSDQPDQFVHDIVARANMKREKGRAANPAPRR